MKAKEYYDLFIELLKKQPTGVDAGKDFDHLTLIESGILSEALTTILLKFDEEMLQIMKTRKCETYEAQRAVVREFQQKWIAFCNLDPQRMVDKGMFVLSIKIMIPKLYDNLPDKLKAEWV